MTPRSAAINASLFGLAWAAAVGFIAAQNTAPGPTEILPRAPILAAFLASPAVMGVVGAAGGRPVVLVAAGILYMVVAPISFGGVTLPFLLPGLVYLKTAVGPVGTSTHRPSLRPERITLAVAASIPIALAIIFTTGILGVFLLVVLAALAPAISHRARHGVPRPGLAISDAALGIAIVGLVVGGGIALLATTETVCYRTFGTPDEPVYVLVPADTGVLGSVGGGCNGGQVSPMGFGVAAVLVIGAVALAVQAALRSGSGAVLGEHHSTTGP